MLRKQPLVTNEIYHIFNRSIDKLRIFTSPYDYQHLIESTQHCLATSSIGRFSWRLRSATTSNQLKPKPEVQIIAYCLMPTHYHFILKQTREEGISRFIGRLQNGYAKYFNVKYARNGPLWDGRFKNILVKTDEQLLHLTRYVHLNPTTSQLCKAPEHWPYSSYLQYTQDAISENLNLCQFKELIDMRGDEYKRFVENFIQEQRDTAAMRTHMLFEDE